jgi:hypothetical protein
MNTRIMRLLLYLGFILVTGCSSSDPSGTNSPRTPVSNSDNAAIFNPLTGEIPLPNVLATATAADPLTGRAANKPMTPPEALAYINKYEVASTNAVAGVNAPIYIRFSSPVDAATVTSANIKVFQLTPDTLGNEQYPLGFTDVSGLFDYTKYTAGSTDLLLFPNFPLLPGTRYLYVVTNRVLDSASGKPVISSTYFDVLKSKYELVGSVAALEPVRANVMSGTTIKFSGYAKVMDDLIAASATTTVTSRDTIALMGRFITTGAGFVSKDAIGTMMPVESALRAFAAGSALGGLTGKTWTNSINTTTTQSADAFWTEVKQTTTTAPATVSKVIKGAINSAQLSIDPVVAKANAASIDLTGVTSGGLPAFNPAAGVTQSFRDGTGALAGYYHTTATVPFVYLVPTGTAPTGGWPLVIFQHGINDKKERVTELAGPLTANGYAVVAIDLPLHGELAISGHPSAYWGFDFMALGYPLAARTNMQQGAFNLNRLDITVLGGGFAALGSDAPNRTTVKPKFVSLSLGSFVGAYYLAGNTTLSTTGYPYTQSTLNSDMRGVLNVPGGRLAYLLLDSTNYGPAAVAGLASAGIVAGTPTFNNFWQATQSVIDPVDPATMTTPLATGLPSRLSGRIVIQEAVGDKSVPNKNTRYLGNALGGRELLGSAGAAVAPGFKQLGYNGGTAPRIPATFLYTLTAGAPSPKVDFAASSATAVAPAEGYFQFDQTGLSHEFLLDPTGSATATKYAQDQMLYFLNKGIVADPSVLALP